MNEKTLAAIQTALEGVYRPFNQSAGPVSSDHRTRDFVFHMTDWIDNLQQLHQFYEEPERHSDEEWDQAVYGGIISHAIGHLLAASRLIDDDVSDPFADYRYTDDGVLLADGKSPVERPKRASA